MRVHPSPDLTLTFEKLLALIPQSDIDRAAKDYEDRLFAWMERYFRYRAEVYEKAKLL